MKVYADIRQKVEIDPKSVIKKLIVKELGSSYERAWVFEQDGKYYKGFDISMGAHSSNSSEEITKDQHDYVMALYLILGKLNEVGHVTIV